MKTILSVSFCTIFYAIVKDEYLAGTVTLASITLDFFISLLMASYFTLALTGLTRLIAKAQEKWNSSGYL